MKKFGMFSQRRIDNRVVEIATNAKQANGQFIFVYFDSQKNRFTDGGYCANLLESVYKEEESIPDLLGQVGKSFDVQLDVETKEICVEHPEEEYAILQIVQSVSAISFYCN